MIDRRTLLGMVIMSGMAMACSAPTPATETASHEVPYAGALPAGPIKAQPIARPCPSCYFTVNDTIFGTLKSSEDYSSSHFPIQWMKAIYKLSGVTQATEDIDIDDGSEYTEFEHEVGATSFDSIYLQWKDAENNIVTATESIPFDN